MVQVIFTVNGPGEVLGWLFPLSTALRKSCPDIRLTACILPCVFSTGAESSVISALGTIDQVLDQRQTLNLIWRNRRPANADLTGPVLVFHLGGEMSLSMLLARRLSAPLYAYVENPSVWTFGLRRVFYSGLNPLPDRIARNPELLVGELMVDAARLRRAGAALPEGSPLRTVALYPGSREYMATFLLPYYAAVVEAVAARRPATRWVMARADFVRMRFLRDLAPPPEDRTWPALPLNYTEDAGGAWLTTPAGVRIRILPGAEVLACADVALTIPGTNTGELAASGVPMVVVLPTYLGHQVPLPGLGGHLGRLPGVGRAIKLAVGHRLLRRLPLLAQPNRRAGRMIVTELVGEGLNDRIEAELLALIDGDTTALRAELVASMGKSGAAERLAAEISAFFGNLSSQAAAIRDPAG